MVVLYTRLDSDSDVCGVIATKHYIVIQRIKAQTSGYVGPILARNVSEKPAWPRYVCPTQKMA
jgi:hypothetical protein